MIDGEQPNQNSLSNEQKIGFVLLLAFSILAIGLGILQIRNTMYGSFALNNQVPANLKDQVDTIDALRFRDTDRDGLSDYDELYVYGTSPYLADTDGDGIPDGVEVKNGTNPNCAEGTDCSIMSSKTELATSTVDAGVDSSTIPNDPVPPVLDIQAAMQDPAQVRKMLISAGVQAEVVNKVSDGDLLQMVKELMVSSTISTSK